MLAYQIIGQGQPLVLLHGFLADSRDFETIVNDLKQAYQCIIIDLPGHGHSKAVTVHTISDIADHIVAVLQHEKITQAIIYGYSMGGRVALQFACLYPQFCQQLILESASPGIQQMDLRQQRQQQDHLLTKSILTNYHQFVHKWRQQPLFDSQQKLSETIKAKQLRMNLSQSPQGIAQSLLTYGTGIQPSLWHKLPHFQLPCLLICGALDHKFVNIAQEMYQLCPEHFQVMIVDEVGHNIHLEQPQYIIQQLMKERLTNERMD